MLRINALFQPLVKHEGAGGRPKFYGAEALARTHPNDTEFIREPGFSWRSVDAEMATLLTRCEELPKNIHQSNLFVNVSQYSLLDDESFDRWLALAERLKATLLSAHEAKLIVEITELVPDESLAARWKAMKDKGLRLAIDDYGTHNSNYDRLSRYDWDYCKFDMKATHSIINFQTAINYCNNSGVSTIAEKIEDTTAARQALDIGIMIHQGYHYARPAAAALLPTYDDVPADEAETQDCLLPFSALCYPV